jgi:uncharacterized protein YjbI with pentapeptide repeats
MAKGFHGQDLRGQSFKNQDLTGADFSDCDLRGVDFSGANLTAAKFRRAKMGRTLKVVFTLSILQLLLSIIAGFTVAIGNFLFALLTQLIFNDLAINVDTNLLLIMLTYALLFAIVTIVAVNSKRFDYMLWFFIVIIVGTGAGEMSGAAVAAAGDAAVAIAIIMAGAVTVAVVAGANGAVAVAAGAIVSSLFVAVAVTFAANTDILESFGHITVNITFVAAGIAGSIASPISIVLGVYLGWRAVKEEESQLLLLRGLSLKLACIGGTQFAFATLKEVDFSQADLKYACFKNTNMINCCFQQAKNHHLALTDETPLKLRKIRDLVTEGIVIDKNFAKLNLRGLDFSGLNLQGIDFNHADLSGTNLSRAKMTGAILEGWNIDTETLLENIDCKYYYYLENGEKKRMPPEGEEYKIGEFTRIFQKVANTIDFIAYNETELAAIKLSTEQIREESGNNEIRVQTLEEKEDFTIVKVRVPKTADRGILYHKISVVKQEFETKAKILMVETREKIQEFQSTIEILKEQLREQRQALLAAIQPQNFIQIEHHQGEIIMGDKNISTNITGSTIHGSVVTAETVENSFNTIQQLPPEHNELKVLLSQLQALINNSPLSEPDKKEALAETKTIAEATTQPEVEQQNIVRKTLRYFKGLSAELEDVPEIAVKLGKTVALIGGLFGL